MPVARRIRIVQADDLDELVALVAAEGFGDALVIESVMQAVGDVARAGHRVAGLERVADVAREDEVLVVGDPRRVHGLRHEVVDVEPTPPAALPALPEHAVDAPELELV